MTRKCSNPDLSSSKLHKTEFFSGEHLLESRVFVGLTLVNFETRAIFWQMTNMEYLQWVLQFYKMLVIEY